MAKADPEKLQQMLDQALGQFGHHPAAPPDAHPDGKLLCAARLLALARARLSDHLPMRLFSDPALEMLLFLHEQRTLGRRVTVTDLASCDQVPTTTGLRYIAAMEGHGLVARSVDERDARRQFIDFTPDGRASMMAYLGEVAALVWG